MLSFEQLRIRNQERARRLSHSKDWSLLEWAGAMCGEAGEAANICKKFHRGDFDNHPDESMRGRDLLAAELADLIIYADLLAANAGINLGEAVKDKFNETSVARFNTPDILIV